MEKSFRTKIENILIISILGIGLYFAVNRFFFLLFPILSALLFSEVIRGSLVKLRPLSDGVKKILIILTLMIFFATLSLLVILLTDRLIHSVSVLSANAKGTIDAASSFALETIHRLEESFSRILGRDMENSLTSSLPTILKNLGEKLLDYIPGWIGDLLSFIPKFFLSLLIFTVCTYYFSCDWKRIQRSMGKVIKKETLEKLEGFKHRFLVGAKQYAKAYTLLYLLTFSELFLGFVLIRVPSPMQKALAVALVDILPIFGCGTILIPWSAFCWIMGNSSQGIKLLVLYFVILLLRQFLEPKIVGDSIGLHPVLSLVFVLAGLSLFGVTGMFLFPLIATCFLGNPPTLKQKEKRKKPLT